MSWAGMWHPGHVCTLILAFQVVFFIVNISVERLEHWKLLVRIARLAQNGAAI
jgi:hypothetical protein